MEAQYDSVSHIIISRTPGGFSVRHYLCGFVAGIADLQRTKLVYDPDAQLADRQIAQYA